jgi:predicted GNAT family acetyltransferase
MATTVRPLTKENWEDFLSVMGPRGGDAGCFCMFNRMTGREFGLHQGEPNRELMRGIVESGEVPGLIGYEGAVPVGWVSVAPREVFGRLQRSPVAKPLDDRDAWAVTCFVIPKQHRGRGVAVAMLEGAVAYAKEKGATVIEGYPVEPRHDRMPDIWAWMGLASMFREAGFTEVARRSETRPFMRRELV